MSTTNRAELFDKLRNVWWFSGESPQFVYGNYRMNEVTAAVGLAQLEKIDGILATYAKTLAILNKAIAGCPWLKPRHVPRQAEMVGYWWACTWEGEKHGLSYERFQKLSEELKVGLRFGFNHYPAQDFPLFRETTAYRTHPDCPVRCPLYTAKSTFRYTWNQTPVCQDLMPRLVTVNLIFLSIPAAETMADRIRTLIQRMEQ